MPESKSTDIEVRSEQVQDILTKVPHWVVSSGSTLLLILILMVISISWFIKYPDIISAQVVLTTENPPEKLFSNASGNFETILVADQDSVEAGEPLAVIKNTALYADIVMLKTMMDNIGVDRDNFQFPIYELPALVLGDLNTSFAAFENNYKEYLETTRFSEYRNKLNADKTALADARVQLEILLENQKISEARIVLERADTVRNKELFDSGIISPREYGQNRVNHLRSELEHANYKKSISQARLQISTLEQSIKNAYIADDQNTVRSLRQTLQAYYELKKALEEWERRYLIKSSIKGQVSMLNIWDKNQTVNTGDLIFTIIPANNKSYIGRMVTPPQNSGKLKRGQQVHISLANYPPDEYGKLNATISSISLVPDGDGNYLVEVSIPSEFKTTYSEEIAFNHEMQGTADIITEDLRLIERFFYQIKGLFN
jgi:multidrug resistance efflux pump